MLLIISFLENIKMHEKENKKHPECILVSNITYTHTYTHSRRIILIIIYLPLFYKK